MKRIIAYMARAASFAIIIGGSLLASSLTVYNMYDRPWNGQTNPIAPCGTGRDDCAVFPYQSIFDTRAVTFNLPNKSIKEFYWKGLVGPRYVITVNLQENEHETLELYNDGGYKFKGKQIQYAKKG